MDIGILTSFFMWCTIINILFLVLAASFSMLLGLDFVYNLHNKFFPIPRQRLTELLYSFIGLYKCLIIVFNAVPFIALLIIA